MKIRTATLLKTAWIPIFICWMGALLNILVVRANGGMPALDLDQPYGKWVPLTSSTQLPFLSDVIPVMGVQCSLGDVVMYLGTATWIYLSVRYLLMYKIQREEGFRIYRK